MILSFGLKIVIKATHRQRNGGDQFGKDSAVTYHIESFVQFVLSEFLLIATWTWFKAPEDFFSIYNSLPMKKFSIFQRLSEGKQGKNERTPKQVDGSGNERHDTLEDGGEEDDHRNYNDTLLSEENMAGDYRQKSTLDKRSL